MRDSSTKAGRTLDRSIPGRPTPAPCRPPTRSAASDPSARHRGRRRPRHRPHRDVLARSNRPLPNAPAAAHLMAEHPPCVGPPPLVSSPRAPCCKTPASRTSVGRSACPAARAIFDVATIGAGAASFTGKARAGHVRIDIAFPAQISEPVGLGPTGPCRLDLADGSRLSPLLSPPPPGNPCERPVRGLWSLILGLAARDEALRRHRGVPGRRRQLGRPAAIHLSVHAGVVNLLSRGDDLRKTCPGTRRPDRDDAQHRPLRGQRGHDPRARSDRSLAGLT